MQFRAGLLKNKTRLFPLLRITGGKWQAYLVLLHCALFVDTVLFYKLKVCGNPALNKSASTIFPTALSHLASLCHTGNFWNISNICIIIVFVIFDVTVVIILGPHELYSYKTANLINKCYVLIASLTGHSRLSSSPRLPYFLRHNNEIRPGDSLTMASECLREGRAVCLPL